MTVQRETRILSSKRGIAIWIMRSEMNKLKGYEEDCVSYVLVKRLYIVSPPGGR